MPLNEIFFIDDDADLLRIVQLALKPHSNVKASFYSTFESVFDEFDRGHFPTLIVVDQIMPEMEGVSFIHTLQKKYGITIPSIILSANEFVVTNKLKRDGIIGALSKPVGLKSFFPKLKELWDHHQVELAVQAYEDHKLVAIPTETVYGLSAPINNSQLISKIFELKERPFFDPLICHVYNKEQAKSLCSSWPEEADRLCDAFWPGPLTIVVTKNKDVSDMITSGLSTVGLRCPNHPLTLELLKKLNVSLAAPSANKFTKTSPTNPEHVTKYFDSSDVFILDGGSCEVGIESTIVGWDQEDKLTIMREGMITAQDIFSKTGITVSREKEERRMKTPGSHLVHYQPPYPLFYGVESFESFAKKSQYSKDKIEAIVLDLDPVIVARNLYSLFLNPLKEGYEARYIQIPESSLNDERWIAIINRLKKASS